MFAGTGESPLGVVSVGEGPPGQAGGRVPVRVRRVRGCVRMLQKCTRGACVAGVSDCVSCCRPGRPVKGRPKGGSSGVGSLPQPGKGTADVLSSSPVETLACDAIRKGVGRESVGVVVEREVLGEAVRSCVDFPRFVYAVLPVASG